jgi:hypothetical protein
MTKKYQNLMFLYYVMRTNSLSKILEKLFEKYIGFLDKCMLKSGVEMLLEMSFILNKYIQDT